ncbi:DNA polymerase III epsilon subunit-like protein [Hephaestia caeni]|uniref:DNA polymerase III epsilon subunit-like protein n=1 Tax=Hephaestia caeni TaxID=645617 RepID=A0A397PCV5_9SPHN|nr:hypothetical protein [Hephaestia caeni]RIA46243.1 DNA polymerase III epsilon subunit-like protein [Hephaestia caeni]
MRLIAIDFEASCLPRHGRSYPIEIGISEDGDTSRSWLIRPHPHWSGWTWTKEAERIHGLSQARVWCDGLPVGQVAAELAEALDGAALIADSPIDGYWLETLFEAAARPCPIPFRPLREILDELGLASDTILAAQARVDARPFGKHRAGEDARWLAALLWELGASPAPDRPLFAWSNDQVRREMNEAA